MQWYDMKSVEVPRPNIVKKYNKCMGGIDFIDWIINYYRMKGRSDHEDNFSFLWSWFCKFLDIVKRRQKKIEMAMKCLEFKISVTELLIESITHKSYKGLNSISSLVTRSYIFRKASIS